jgi:hypothetical protein
LHEVKNAIESTKNLVVGERLEMTNSDLKNRSYYGGVAWYLFAHKIKDKAKQQTTQK